MSPTDDYDSLSAAEREVRDKEDRVRELAEQAGTVRSIYYFVHVS